MTPIEQLSAYSIIASLSWVGFLSIMFILSGSKKGLCEKARIFLISKLILCLILIGSTILFVWQVPTTTLVPVVAIWIFMWMILTTILNYRKEKEMENKEIKKMI